MVMAGQLVLNGTGSSAVWGRQHSRASRIQDWQVIQRFISFRKPAVYTAPYFMYSLSVGRCKNGPRIKGFAGEVLYMLGFMRFFSCRV